MGAFRRFFRIEGREDVSLELAFHLESRVEDLMRQGMPHDEARRRALREFGDMNRYTSETRRVDREYDRVARARALVASVLADVRYTIRGMRRAPALAAAAVLTVAVGVGANTAVWAIVDALARRPLPIEKPHELYALRRAGVEDGNYRFSHPQYLRLAAELPNPRQAAAMTPASALYVVIDDTPVALSAQLVSGTWFPMLGVRAAAGRLLGESDDTGPPPGAAPAVISHAIWQSRFGSDPAIVGRTLQVNRFPVQIVGVAEKGFGGLFVGRPVSIWLPITAQHEVGYSGSAASYDSDTGKPWPPQNGIHWLRFLARIPSESFGSVRAALQGRHRVELAIQAAARDSAERAELSRERAELEPIPRGFSALRDEFKDPLRMLTASVGFVLLIACANLAGLMLARSAARQHETAVRVSLGAQRGRLVRQLLTESLTLALVGGVVSVAIARAGVAALLRLASSGPRPVPLNVTIDASVLAYAFAVTVLTGLLVGLPPAFRLARSGLFDAFRAATRATGSARGHRLPLGRMLVAGQIALTLVLVVTAGVFARTLQNLLAVDVGYDRDRVLAVRMDVRAAGYERAQLPGLYDQLLSRAAALPGVRNASVSAMGLAVSAQWISTFKVAGREVPSGTSTGHVNLVSPTFFATTGIPLYRGRAFAADDRQGGERVAIVSESFARHFFGTDEVVGQRFGYDEKPEFTIVGVVRDARVNSIKQSPPRMVYRPIAQEPRTYISSIEVRVDGPPSPIIAGLRRAIKDVAPAVPISEIVTLGETLERGLSRERMLARIAGAFGLLALLLAGIGIYGTMAYSVSRRTNEMGVRMALGAEPRRLQLLIIGESALVALLGVAAGLLLLVPTQRLTQNLLFGVTAFDPASTTIAAGILFTVAVLAALVPAVRAARTDPVSALRAS